MWKKLALLAAVAGTLTQAWRYWKQANDAAARRDARRRAPPEVQRWEGEGGNLAPDAASVAADDAAPRAARKGRSGPQAAEALPKTTSPRPRVRASTGALSRRGRSATSPAA